MTSSAVGKNDLVIDCGECVGEGQHGPLGVLVSPTGDLRIVCQEHETIIAFWQNSEIAERLRSIALSGCSEHNHKEVSH